MGNRLSPVRMLIRNLGLQTEVNEISKKEKFLRKKHMGVFRWESSSVRMMIVRFTQHSAHMREIKRKKIPACILESSVRPRRMNSVTDVLFLISGG